MAIPISFYIYINSVVGGGTTVGARDFALRLFTSNPLLPPLNPEAPYNQTQYGILRFSSAFDVGVYFGTSSEEYYRALQYFSYVDVNFNSTPDFIQFSRWVDVACAPLIYPNKSNGTVIGNWTSIDDGAFTLTMGGFTFAVTGLDFTGETTLAGVAGVVEDAIQAETGGGAVWTAATVTYSASYGGFILTGGATDVVTNPISVNAPSSGTNITGLTYLGWLPQEQVAGGNLISGAIWASGSAVQTITETLTTSANISNDFVSFAFLNNLFLTLVEKEEAATFANTQANYVYLTGDSSSTVFATQMALSGYGWTGLTLNGLTSTQAGTLTNSSVTVTGLSDTSSLVVGQPVSGSHITTGTTIATIVNSTSITLSIAATGAATEVLTFSLIDYPEQLPGAIAAATQYESAGSVVNFMYKSLAALTPSVSTEASALAYSDVNINFYGVTQQAGQYDAFYQPGLLQGGSTQPQDMGVAFNEIWLKDQMTVAFYNLLRGTNQVPANQQGQAQLLSVGQSVITQALTNGVISPGKALNALQIVAVTNATKSTMQPNGDPNAWQQVQSIGYWFNVLISQNDSGIYIATYTLIYSKADSIRFIYGNDFLI